MAREQVLDAIRGAERLTLICHENPDADTLGAALALRMAGERLGKAAEVVAADGVPPFLTGLPAYADIVAGNASVAAVHYLVRGTSHLLGRVMIIDFGGMRIDTEDVLRLPRCPVCASRRPPYRPPFPEGVEANG